MASTKTCSTRDCSAAQARKSNKPLMEKRRRARINDCLSELKSLLMESLKKDASGYSKLEKADILELTVKYLRSVQRQQVAAAAGADANVMSKYRAGFNECAQEVARYVNSSDNVDSRVRTQLIDHLAQNVRAVNQMPTSQTQNVQCMQPIQIQIPNTTQSSTTVPLKSGLLQPVPLLNGASPTILTPPHSAGASEAIKITGNFQMVPGAAMPTQGSVAFIVPSQFMSNGQSPVFITSGHAAAQAIPVYATITPSSSPVSQCNTQLSTPSEQNTPNFLVQQYNTTISPEVKKPQSPVWRPW